MRNLQLKEIVEYLKALRAISDKQNEYHEDVMKQLEVIFEQDDDEVLVRGLTKLLMDSWSAGVVAMYIHFRGPFTDA